LKKVYSVLILLIITIGVAITIVINFIPSENVLNSKKIDENSSHKEIKPNQPANLYTVNSKSSTAIQNSHAYILDEAYFAQFKVGVHFTDLNSSPLPESEKSSIREAMNNLNRTGSSSGGIITHEFQNSDYYKKRLQELGGINGIQGNLNFQPTNMKFLDGYSLVGGDYSGSYVEKSGFNSIYSLYENPNGAKIEVSETYLNPATSSVLEFYKEGLNYNINNVPMTLENLKDASGNQIYDATWVSNDRVYSLSSENITKENVSEIVGNIINSKVINPPK
jgi:hypothetical protein